MLIEVEAASGRNPMRCVREAVGQLLEYKYFGTHYRLYRPCIFLDRFPGDPLVTYVEGLAQKMLVMWVRRGKLCAGPATAEWLEQFGVGCGA
ncbi:MAG: hypothetical protein ACRD2F_08500 [Terriglobales bacterium]